VESPQAAKPKRKAPHRVPFLGAGDEARTRYLHLGKVALYQMSYARKRNSNYNKIRGFVKKSGA
jgi:hypothetical protein